MATKHRGDANKPSPSEFKAEMHKGAKPGEWQGAYVALRPINATKIINETKAKK